MSSFKGTHACSINSSYNIPGRNWGGWREEGERGWWCKKKHFLHNWQYWYTLLLFGFIKGFDKQQRARVPGGQTKLLPKCRREIVTRMLVVEWRE